MEQTFYAPRLVRRKKGGWLALSGSADSLKIGVSAPTEEAAREQFSVTANEWRRMLQMASEHPDNKQPACP